jgi:hypothetical protein
MKVKDLPPENEAAMSASAAKGRLAWKQGDIAAAEASFLEAWRAIPEPRVEYDYATSLARGLVDFYCQTKQYDKASSWLPTVREAYGGGYNPSVELLAAKVAFEAGHNKQRDLETRLKAKEWKTAQIAIEGVFATLERAGLVALQDAGTTQEDGFSDCSEIWHERGGAGAGLHGFCYYTRQDLQRAKRSALLSLAFWGAPEGAPVDMERVGKLIVESFRASGFEVDWDGTGGMRPIVHLHRFSAPRNA